MFHLPCGKCVGCQIDKANSWAIRCWHETLQYKNNIFVTLTYNNDNLPIDESVNKRVIQLFLKKLRMSIYRDYLDENKIPYTKKLNKEELSKVKKDLEKLKIKHFTKGEYGSKYGRPHYHMIIFNYMPDDLILYDYNRSYPLYKSEKLEKIWGNGLITIGNATMDAALYCIKYMAKITNKKKRPDWLEPEFTLMSKRPGIGHDHITKNYRDIIGANACIVLKKSKLLKMSVPTYYNTYIQTNYPEIYEKYAERRQQYILDNAVPDDLRMVKLGAMEPRLKRLQMEKLKKRSYDDETVSIVN